MAFEPINIFSHTIDPAGVLKSLRQLAPDLSVDGPADNWSTIVIPGPKRFFRKAPTLTIGHDSEYYSDAEWPRQVLGMQGYFHRYPHNEMTPRVLATIGAFRFALSFPSHDLDITSSDPRMKYVYAIAKHLDGVIFTPSALRDASGRIFYGALTPDPTAVLPKAYVQMPAGPVPAPADVPDDDYEDEEQTPPTAERVARRACALAAVAGRALLEQESPNDPGVEETRKRIQQWVKDIGIEDELEPDEAKILQHPLGVPPPRDTLNSTWRLEGLVVLAWALNRFAWIPYDELCDPGQLLPSVGIVKPDRAKAIISEPALRPIEELAAMQTHLLGLHWRIRNYSLDHKAMDFKKFADNAWFGKLPLDNIRLINGDLALKEYAIADAPEEVLQACSSSVMERHLAINWLMGYAERYSDTDTST